MTHLDLTELLLYAAVFFLASLSAYANADHSTKPFVKQASEAVGAGLTIIAALWTLAALIRTW